MTLAEFQQLFVHAITTGMFLSFIVSFIVLVFSKGNST